MLWSGWIWGLYKVSACSVGRPPLCSKVCTVVQKGRWLPFIESTIFHVLCTHTIYFQTFLGKVQHKNTKYGGKKGHLLHYYSSSTFHIQINEMVKPKLHEIISATRCLPRVLSLLLFIICIWWGLISWVSSFPWNMTTIFVQWLSLHQGPLPVHIWNKFGLNGKYGGIDKTADRKNTYQVLTFAKGKGTHTYTCIFFTSYTCHSWKFENFWFWSWALTMFFFWVLEKAFRAEDLHMQNILSYSEIKAEKEPNLSWNVLLYSLNSEGWKIY